MTGQFVIEVVCQWPIMGRYVKVSIPVGKILTLCEVEVMGVREEGKWIFLHATSIVNNCDSFMISLNLKGSIGKQYI